MHKQPSRLYMETYEMIKLLDRKVTGIGKWTNKQEQILKKKIDIAPPSKFQRLPSNKNEYLKALVYLRHSAQDYLAQSNGLAPMLGISNITMSFHSNHYCGGYGIRIRILNPKGKECVTSRKESSPGDLLIWNNPTGGNCEDMEISWLKTRVYIESNDGNDFCPKVVTIYTDDSTFATNEIVSWYDSSTNSLQHNIYIVEGGNIF